MGWIEQARRVPPFDRSIVGVDQHGRQPPASRRSRGWWDRPLDWRRPSHWLPLLRSWWRGEVAELEAGEDCPLGRPDLHSVES